MNNMDLIKYEFAISRVLVLFWRNTTILKSGVMQMVFINNLTHQVLLTQAINYFRKKAPSCLARL